MRKNSEFIGIGLIIIGAILLLGKMGIVQIGWATLWPLFILIPGLIFQISFLLNRDIPGVLVPGGILTVVGATFLVCALFGWGLMGILWPLFPFSVAFGLFQLYLFGGRDKGILIPVGIIGGFSLVSLLSTTVTVLLGGFIPFLLIGLGLLIFVIGRRGSSSDM